MTLPVEHTNITNRIVCPLLEFSTHLSGRNYSGAAQVVERAGKTTYVRDECRQKTIQHLHASASLAEARILLDRLIAYDAGEDSYGLHVDWLASGADLFQAALKSYTESMSPEKIQQKLKDTLAVFLTYRSFTVPQAKLLIAEMISFDPLGKANAQYGQTFLETARCYSNHEVIDYLESLSGAASGNTSPVSVDYAEFSGIPELKGSAAKRAAIHGTAKLNTLLEIYQFIGPNPAVEGDPDFFKRQIDNAVNARHLDLPNALAEVRQFYKGVCERYMGVKSLLDRIEVFGTQEVQLDSSMTNRKKTGKLHFNGRDVVCKFLSTIHPPFNWIDPVVDLAQFVFNVNRLKATVPNVVEVRPQIILNRRENGDTQVGCLMELAPGKQLRQISQLTSDEKREIQDQFDRSVRAMLEAGYALYDFSDDNVLWDGKKLTFIDLSPAGFNPISLEHADTENVILRMSQMLVSK